MSGLPLVVAVAISSGLLLSACSSAGPVHDALSLMPPGKENHPVKSEAYASAAQDPHRQYLDARSHRYFYFDPEKQIYCWEDGTPK